MTSRPLSVLIASLASLVVLVGPARGQGVPAPPTPAQPPTVTGGPGNSQVNGGPGSQRVTDPAPDDADQLSDSKPCSDGASDVIDATDGDGDDVMTGGPEDTFQGDPLDVVVIEARGGTRVLWIGRFQEWQMIRRMIKWLQDGVKSVVLAGGGPPTQNEWIAALLAASQALDDAGCPGSPLDLNSCFVLGPYVVGELPSSPADFLYWFNPHVGDAEECDGSWYVEQDEYDQAVASTQELLLEAIDAAIAGGDWEGDGN